MFVLQTTSAVLAFLLLAPLTSVYLDAKPIQRDIVAPPQLLFEDTRMHRPPYASILNQIFRTLRTETPEEAWAYICGLKGLCYQQGACATPIELAFFWWICSSKSLGFRKSPEVKQSAKRFHFNMRSGTFYLDGKHVSAETYLAQHLRSTTIPSYMAYMMVKTIVQAPAASLPHSPDMRRAACKALPTLCRK